MGKIIDHNNFWYIEKNPISKTGVFPYLGREIGYPGLEPNKIYYVLRSEQELMSPEAIKSFELLPITKGHRMLGPQEQGLTPAEKIPQQGVVGEKVFAEGDTLYANIKVTSEQAKNDINNGLKELSLGYFCRWVKEAGEYKGQHYDFAQKNIRGNHLAIVPLGRMGHDVRVMDALPQNAPSYACDSLELAGPFVSALLPAGHKNLKLFNLPGQAQDEDKITWITVKGNHIPIKEGQSKEDALKAFFDKKASEGKVKSPEEDVKSIEEAEKILTQKLKVMEGSYGSFPLDMAKEMNKAIATLPEEHRPIFVGNASEAFKRAGLERNRPLKTFYGVNLSSDKIGEEGEYVIGINTQKYKSFESIEKRKKEIEAEYQKKTGKKYFFNKSGKATLYHEAGHVYLNKGVMPKGFEAAAERWYRESGYGIIKPNYEGFGGKYDEAFAEAWAGYFTQNPELPDYIAKFISDIVSKNNAKSEEKTEKQDIFTPSAELAERFKNEVQNVLADDKVSPRTELSLGETPQIYVNLGLPKGELKTNKMTLLKALGKTGKHPHNVPIKVLEELPALIMDPQAVFKSLSTSSNPSGYISVLDAVDKAGKPIIAVISPNKKDENEISFIPSVYERNNFNNFVSNVIKENGVLYIKERTVLPSLHNAVLQRNTVPTNKILTKEDFVKDLQDLGSTKTNGADGISAAPEKKENAQMDKSKIAAEILAIASKPESEFEDGKEGQMKAVIGLLDKVADNKSASGANDDKGALEEDKADSANPSEKDEKDDTANDKAPCDKDKAEDALEARIMEKMAKKLALYEKVSPFTGSFDHTPMSLAQMAKYACDKLGIKGIAEDSAETALTGYLAGAQKQVVFREAVNGAVGDAMPVEKDAAFEKYLKEAN